MMARCKVPCKMAGAWPRRGARDQRKREECCWERKFYPKQPISQKRNCNGGATTSRVNVGQNALKLSRSQRLLRNVTNGKVECPPAHLSEGVKGTTKSRARFFNQNKGKSSSDVKVHPNRTHRRGCTASMDCRKTAETGIESNQAKQVQTPILRRKRKRKRLSGQSKQMPKKRLSFANDSGLTSGSSSQDQEESSSVPNKSLTTHDDDDDDDDEDEDELLGCMVYVPSCEASSESPQCDNDFSSSDEEDSIDHRDDETGTGSSGKEQASCVQAKDSILAPNLRVDAHLSFPQDYSNDFESCNVNGDKCIDEGRDRQSRGSYTSRLFKSYRSVNFLTRDMDLEGKTYHNSDITKNNENGFVSSLDATKSEDASLPSAARLDMFDVKCNSGTTATTLGDRLQESEFASFLRAVSFHHGSRG